MEELSIGYSDLKDLYRSYMPFLKSGGLFVRTPRQHKMGQSLALNVTLPDSLEPMVVTGKVAWITPPHATGARTQGIGIRFPNDEKSALLKKRIEEILGAHLGSDRSTQTV